MILNRSTGNLAGKAVAISKKISTDQLGFAESLILGKGFEERIVAIKAVDVSK